MSDYKKLLVWQKAIELAIEIYKVTKSLPEDEKFGLSSQMRRAVISIPSNIAEGQSRHSKKEFIHFLRIAQGSNSELETQLILCENLSYLSARQGHRRHLLLPAGRKRRTRRHGGQDGHGRRQHERHVLARAHRVRRERTPQNRPQRGALARRTRRHTPTGLLHGQAPQEIITFFHSFLLSCLYAEKRRTHSHPHGTHGVQEKPVQDLPRT